jgi:hypothetical protein
VLVGADNEDSGLEMIGAIPGPHDVELEYLRKEFRSVVRNVFMEQYARVTNPKHKRIIDTWQASHFEATTCDIAARVGVSQSYVSQVLNNFKYSLRKGLEAYLE